MSISIAQWARDLATLEAGGAQAGELGAFFEAAYDFPADRERILGRYRAMTRVYTARFDSSEFLAARAPGRINLIGEHTDYNGLPVFPVAVDRDMAALFGPSDDGTVVLANTDPSFPERSFRIGESIPPYPTGDWGNYCKAAVQGLVDHYASGGKDLGGLRGFRAVVDGNIPVAAGMSSSSALVVLCALMFLAANGSSLADSQAGRIELAELLAKAERYVGTQGGGMDQAISLLGQPGQALKIDFFPLKVQPVPLPPGYTVVVANSLVQAAKTATALDKYNRRPIECRLAVALLRKVYADRCGRETPLELLGDLREEKLGVTGAEIRQLADAALHEHPYTLKEIAAALDQSPEQTAQSYCLRRDGTVFPEPPEGFKLFQRYRHVVEEGRRVDQSVQALASGDVGAFAELMNRSHESCRDLYEISCPELDALVSIAREAGALGSRLTGAGFGGCTVSLVRSQAVGGFIDTIIRTYFRDYLKRPPQEPGSIVFPCRSVAGASILGRRPRQRRGGR